MVGFLVVLVLGVGAGILLLSSYRPQSVVLTTRVASQPLHSNDTAPSPTPVAVFPATDHNSKLLHPSLARDAAPGNATQAPVRMHGKRDLERLSSAELEAIRRRFVCHYTPDTTHCNHSLAVVNLYHRNREMAQAVVSVDFPREAPEAPTALLAAYVQEPGLRQLMHVFEHTHVPMMEACSLMGAAPRGQALAGGSVAPCVTPDMLNPPAAQQSFAEFQSAPPYPRPSAALRKKYFQYPGFPFIDGSVALRLLVVPQQAGPFACARGARVGAEDSQSHAR